MPLPGCFEEFSWHDNAVHGFRVLEGPDGCSGELVLDIDYLVEWLPPKAKGDGFGFRIQIANVEVRMFDAQHWEDATKAFQF